MNTEQSLHVEMECEPSYPDAFNQLASTVREAFAEAVTDLCAKEIPVDEGGD